MGSKPPGKDGDGSKSGVYASRERLGKRWENDVIIGHNSWPPVLHSAAAPESSALVADGVGAAA